MNSFIVLQALVAARLIAAAPALQSEQPANCGDWDKVETGSYTTYNNLWNKDSADSGKQCFSVDGLNKGKLSWYTTSVVFTNDIT